MMASLLPFIAVPLIMQKDYHAFWQIIEDLPALAKDWYLAIEQQKFAWLGAGKQWRSMQIEPENFTRWFDGHGQELVSYDLWRYAECLAIEEARPKVALLYYDPHEIECDERKVVRFRHLPTVRSSGYPQRIAEGDEPEIE